MNGVGTIGSILSSTSLSYKFLAVIGLQDTRRANCTTRITTTVSFSSLIVSCPFNTLSNVVL